MNPGDKQGAPDTSSGNRAGGDVIETGNIEGVGIAIGTGASVRIYGDIHYYPIKLHAPLRSQFAPLIEDRTRLFGGRRQLFDQIGQFIADPAGGYLVVTAPAGFGKTTLMANLVNHTPQAFAYHFFSPLYSSESLNEDFFLRNVVEQMAQWHGRKEQLPERLDELRALYQQFLAEPLERTQVLVLDGLDEVRGWRLAPYLSRQLPRNLHLVLTVRDVGQDWRRDYGLPAGQVTGLPLEGLTRDDVVQVLTAAGQSAVAFVDEPQLLDEVIRISAYPEEATLGADPFYVRILAEDIASGQLKAETLSQQPPGLNAYLDKWWQDIRTSAGDTPTRDLFGTLAVALGPIARTDLEALNPRLVDSWDADFFQGVVSKVRRFIFGDDERGYTLIHPRLRQYMRSKIKNTQDYLDKLLAYCAGWPTHPSPYVLAYYAQHLKDEGHHQLLYALINKAWMDLKFDCTFSHRAFATDVDLAIAAAAVETPPNWAQLVRNCLISVSLRTLATQVPPKLLGVLVHFNQVDRARGYALLMQDADQQSEAYRWIAEALLAKQQSAEAKTWLEQARLAVEKSPHGLKKMLALSRLAQTVAEAGEKQLTTAIVSQILAVIGTLKDAHDDTAEVWVNITQALAKVGEKDGLDHAVTAQTLPSWGYSRAHVFRCVAQAFVRLGEEEQAWSVAAEQRYEGSQAYIIGGIAQALAQIGKIERATEVANGVLPMLTDIQDAWYRAETVSALAAVFSLSDAKELLHRVFTVAESLKYFEELRAKALSSVALAFAQAGMKQGVYQVLQAVQTEWEDNYVKVQALGAVAQALIQIGEIEHAVVEIESIWQYEVNTRGALRDVAVKLAQAGEVNQALAIAQRIDFPRDQVEALSEIAQVLLQIGARQRAEGIANLVLHGTQTIDYLESWKENLLSQVARTLAQIGQFDQALEVAQESLTEGLGRGILSDLAQVFVHLYNQHGLSRVLHAVEEVKDENDKAYELKGVAQAVAQVGDRNGLNDALQIAETIQGQWAKAAALSGVALGLAKADVHERAEAITDRLLRETALSEEDGSAEDSADLLINLVQALSLTGQADKVRRALQIIEERIVGQRHKAMALSKVAQVVAQDGDKASAIDIADRALAVVEAIQSEEFLDLQDKAYALDDVAQALAQLGNKDSLNRAFLIAQRISVDYLRAYALTWVARALAIIGDKAWIKPIISLAEKMQDDFAKGYILVGIAKVLVQMDARDLFRPILSTAQTIGSEPQRAGIQSDLVCALARIGDFDQAMQIAQKITLEGAKAVALSGIAEAMGQQGQNDLACQTLCTALTVAQQADRHHLFAMLEHSVPLLAAIDQGQTLYRVYKEIMAAESWWAKRIRPHETMSAQSR